MKYDIFISHSSKDKETARWLHKEFTALGWSAWFDTHEIEGGEDWIKEIEQGVDSSTIVIVIWTRHASESKWVGRELARADESDKLIFPLIFDDTQRNAIMQTTQFIDFRISHVAGFQELVSALSKHLDASQEINNTLSNTLAWSYQPHPFLRSRFLEENNYLSPNAANFALNFHTLKLRSRRDETSDFPFLSLVAIPIPNSTIWDLNELIDKLNLSRSRVVKRQDEIQYAWEYFDFDNISEQVASRRDVKYIKSWRQENNVDLYVRFNEEGAIEVGESYYSSYFDNQRQKHFFNLLVILGLTWKLINLTMIVHERTGYTGQFQILVNLRRSENGILIGFADGWGSFANEPIERYQLEEIGRGISRDTNMQFVYNLNTAVLSKSLPNFTRDLIEDLSNRIQRSFNYRSQPRHYEPNTTEFPWDNLERQIRV